jgi:type II secretory pathway pseudopilin PulG
MPASTPPLPSSAARRPGPKRALRGDSEGVSEVVGYLLVFGILSIVLVLSMSAFSVGQEAAQGRAVQLRAESAAARVAGVVVQTAILAEQQGTGAAVAYEVDLPTDLEGASYTVSLEAGIGAFGCSPSPTCVPDLVRVEVPAFLIDVTAPVFSVSAPALLSICTTEVSGGPLFVRIYGTDAPPTANSRFAAHPTCAANQLFLEAS